MDLKIVVINILDNSEKKDLLISILKTKKSIPANKQVDVARIGVDTYRVTCRLKKAQVFAISMRNLEYQAEKEAKLETDLRTLVLVKYHGLLDVFSKKDSNTLFSYQKYDYKIILKKKQKYSHVLFYKMSLQELNAVKRYLDLHLAKRFIQASLASSSSLVLFVKKPDKKIGFYVDYQRLNTISKKNRYPIPLIENTLAQLESTKYFTKIDICQAFYQIKIFEGSEKPTTLLTRFGVIKYLVMPFDLYNKLASW